MIVLKLILLLLGLLLVALCDDWPRDQNLEAGEKKQLKNIPHQQNDGWDHGELYEYSGTGHRSAGAQKEIPEVSETVHYPLMHGHVNPSHGNPSEDLSVDAEGGSEEPSGSKTLARMGNWCAFVHKRVVTIPVVCNSETYTIKSQSPCPNRMPDCHLVMYKLSTRPVYREKQKIITALLWRCCPGHGGTSCEDIVANSPELSSSDIRLHPGGPEFNNTGSEKLTDHQTQEHNRHQESRRSLHESIMSEENQPEKHHSSDDTPDPHTGHEPDPEKGASNRVYDRHQSPSPDTHYTNPGLVPIHYLKDVMMSHLQPIFDSFNLTLARLSEEVQDLQRDMTQLQLNQMLQGESKATGGEISKDSEQEAAMADTIQRLDELNLQIDLQHDEMEKKLHAQQVMLHYNLTNLKTDMDVRIQQNQKMLQTSLHSLNSSLSEVRENHDQLVDELQRVVTLIRSPGRQSQEHTAVWEAITRLDNKVVNNTILLSALNHNQVEMSGRIEHLQKGWKTLKENITQIDQKNNERYIEAFLEVDAAKEALGKYDDLSTNVDAAMVALGKYDDLSKHVTAATVALGKYDDLSKHVTAATVALRKYDDLSKNVTAAMEALGKYDDLSKNVTAAMVALGKYDDLSKHVTAATVALGKYDDLAKNVTAAMEALGKYDDLSKNVTAAMVALGKYDDLSKNVTAAMVALGKYDDLAKNVTAAMEALGKYDDLSKNMTAAMVALGKYDDLAKNVTAAMVALGKYDDLSKSVTAAMVALGKYDKLLKNVTALQSTVHEMEDDVDHLFKLTSDSRYCDCTHLSTSVAQLKQAVANITVNAYENMLARDNAAEDRVNISENDGWGPLMEEIKLGLITVQNSLALEQEKRRKLQHALTTLQTSFSDSQNDIEGLQQRDSQKAADIKYLYNSFNSLLKDAIRQTDVLEIMLGDEVIEVGDWSEEKKTSYSIPVLKQVISDLQEQINGHSRSLASMLNSEDPTAGAELAGWPAEALKKKHKSDHDEPTVHKDKDFSAPKKTVEQLQPHDKLGQHQCPSCCNCTHAAASKEADGKLQAELKSVRKSLDDHLRIFSSVFSNTDELTGSEATVDLDKLSALMKKKDTRHQRKRQKKRKDTSEGAHHSKRDTWLKTAVHSQLPENQLMFVASRGHGITSTGTVVFETTSFNHGQMYSPETGIFRAPTAGVYLFVLSLDFGPGPSLVQLKKGDEVAASLHQNMRKSAGPATRVCLLELQQGEELQLELVQGTLEHGKPKDNTFAGVLLLQTT